MYWTAVIYFQSPFCGSYKRATCSCQGVLEPAYFLPENLENFQHKHTTRNSVALTWLSKQSHRKPHWARQGRIVCIKNWTQYWVILFQICKNNRDSVCHMSLMNFRGIFTIHRKVCLHVPMPWPSPSLYQWWRALWRVERVPDPFCLEPLTQ